MIAVAGAPPSRKIVPDYGGSAAEFDWEARDDVEEEDSDDEEPKGPPPPLEEGQMSRQDKKEMIETFFRDVDLIQWKLMKAMLSAKSGSFEQLGDLQQPLDDLVTAAKLRCMPDLQIALEDLSRLVQGVWSVGPLAGGGMDTVEDDLRERISHVRDVLILRM